MTCRRAVLFAAVALFAAFAADPEPRWRELNRTAREAVQAKDYGKLRETLLALRPLLPGNPRIAYNLAASEAMLGNRDAALTGLGNLAAMGLVYDLAADSDFASLRALPGFQAVTARMAASRKPVTRSALIFPIAEPDLIPEDLAHDPSTGRFFYSSVRRGRIYLAAGKEFARADWSVFALRADPARRLLWASTGWVAQCEACKPEDKDKSALLAFDLDSGALKQRIESLVPGLLGDMTISPKGDLFVCEGLHGAILHLAAGAKELVRLDPPGEFPSPQTPALSADGKTLYVPDYLRGIAAIRLSDRHVEWLQPAATIALNGIDGLYITGRNFLAVQNGTNPPRVMRFSLDLQRQELLEANSSWLGEPTHGVLAGEHFYFIANAGWDQYDAQGKKKPGAASVESSIRRLPLP